MSDTNPKNVKVQPMRMSELLATMKAMQDAVEDDDENCNSPLNRSFIVDDIESMNSNSNPKPDVTYPCNRSTNNVHHESNAYNQTYPCKESQGCSTSKVKNTKFIATPVKTPKYKLNSVTKASYKTVTPRSSSKKKTPSFLRMKGISTSKSNIKRSTPLRKCLNMESSTSKSVLKNNTPLRKCLNMEDGFNFKSTGIKCSLFSGISQQYQHSRHPMQPAIESKLEKPVDQIFATPLTKSSSVFPKVANSSLVADEHDSFSQQSSKSTSVSSAYQENSLFSKQPDIYATPQSINVSSNMIIKECRTKDICTPHKEEETKQNQTKSLSTQHNKVSAKLRTPLHPITDHLKHDALNKKSLVVSSAIGDKENIIINSQDGHKKQLFNEPDNADTVEKLSTIFKDIHIESNNINSDPKSLKNLQSNSVHPFAKETSLETQSIIKESNILQNISPNKNCCNSPEGKKQHNIVNPSMQEVTLEKHPIIKESGVLQNTSLTKKYCPTPEVKRQQNHINNAHHVFKLNNTNVLTNNEHRINNHSTGDRPAISHLPVSTHANHRQPEETHKKVPIDENLSQKNSHYTKSVGGNYLVSNNIHNTNIKQTPVSKCNIEEPKIEKKNHESENPRENHQKDRQHNTNIRVPQSQGIQSQFKTMTIKGKHYTVLGKLGSGGSSEVFQVMDVSNSMYAVKCVNLAVNSSVAQGYIDEIKLLQRLQGSDRVITMYDYEYLERQRKLYVVLEMGNVDLSNLIKSYRAEYGKLPLPMLVYYWTEMLTAVQHIHNNDIIHSDLKPANFLLVKGRLKLIDFGIALSLSGDATSVIRDSTTGTLHYISPEAIADESGGHAPKISYKSDVWSLGCILYSMLYGKTPFSHVTHPWAKIAALCNPNQVIDFPELEGVPSGLMNAVRWCLTFDVKKRPSVQELLDLPYIIQATSSPKKFKSPKKIPPSILVKIKEALTAEEWKTVTSIWDS